MRLVPGTGGVEIGRTQVIGRLLRCTRCGTDIDLIEIPHPDPTITPETFACVRCQQKTPERPPAPWEIRP